MTDLADPKECEHVWLNTRLECTACGAAFGIEQHPERQPETAKPCVGCGRPVQNEGSETCLSCSEIVDDFRTDEVAYDAFLNANALKGSGNVAASRAHTEAMRVMLPVHSNVESARAHLEQRQCLLLGPVRAQLKWFHNQVGLDFVDERSLAWAHENQAALTKCFEVFFREYAGRPILTNGNRAVCAPLNPSALYVGELLTLADGALRAAFPNTTLVITCEEP